MSLNLQDNQREYIKSITDHYINNSIGMLYAERKELSDYFVSQCITKENIVVTTNTCADLKGVIDDLSAARATMYDIRTSIYDTIGYQAVVPYRKEAASERNRNMDNILEYNL